MITATYVRDIAAVRLDWDSISSLTEIIRTDTAGTHPVRQYVSGPLGTSGRLIDYEVALSGAVHYQARDSAGGVETVTVTLPPACPSAILMRPERADLRAVALQVLSWEETGQVTVPPARPLGRPEVVSTLWAAPDTHVRCRLLYGSYERAAAAREIAAGHIVQLRQRHPDGLDSYLWVEAARVRSLPALPGRPSLWEVELDGLRQPRPSGLLQGTPGWDYAQLAASYNDYADIAARARDYRALQGGHP